MGILETALQYQERGFSVIPIQRNKKPFFPWQKYQEEKASPEQIEEWWKKWPAANVGVVTGKISGIDVLDIDSKVGLEALREIESALPETPTARTPRGNSYHLWFSYTKGLTNKAKVLTDCDLRTDGGYIVAPPSTGENGKLYEWLPKLSIVEVQPAALPPSLNNLLLNNAFNRGIGGNVTESNKPLQAITSRNIIFGEGGRDEALFCLANHLVKSGMGSTTIEDYLYFFAANCNPPFPVKEVQAKIHSALNRARTRSRNLTQDIRDYLSVTWGNISVTNLCQALQIVTSEERAKCRVVLKRLVDDADYPLERVEGKDGWYRNIDRDCETIDFLNAETETTDVSLPFDLHDLVEIMPGNIITIAGEPNAGKTGLLLNIVKDNMNKFNVHYFSSEMGGSEFRKRLSKFDDIPLKDWKFTAKERAGDFADVIKPGKGNINIIDFLEVHEDFFKVGGMMMEIYKKLKGAIAIIAIQKNKDSDTGLGGFRSLEKPRLYLAVSPGKIKIVKAKNWKTDANPNGMEQEFKLAAGCKLFPMGGWRTPN